MPLKPGFCAVARRARVPLVPVAIFGSYEAFSRDAKLPRPIPICIHFGAPMTQGEVAEWCDERLLAEVESRMLSALDKASSQRSNRDSGAIQLDKADAADTNSMGTPTLTRVTQLPTR